MPGFEGLAHFVPIAAIVIQTATTSIGQVRTVSGYSLQRDRRATHPKLEAYRFSTFKRLELWQSE